MSLTPELTLDDFAASILVPSATSQASSPLRTRTPAQDSYFHSSLHPNFQTRYSGRTSLSPLSQVTPSPTFVGQQGSSPQIANVILARDLDKAPIAVQIQALELLRTRRIFTRTNVQIAPKQFLFIAVLGAGSGGEARVTDHLNDHFYIAHWHDPLDGFVHLEERDAVLTEDEDGDDAKNSDSDASVVRRPSRTSRTSTLHGRPLPSSPGKSLSDGLGKGDEARPLISGSDIKTLLKVSREVSVDVEILRYQMNMVSFLRMHHAVAGGITSTATTHFGTLIRSMAVLHGLDYVTPALVVLALRKIYLHRIRVVRDPSKERSVQWGSDVAAVEQLLEGLTPEEILEDVVEQVDMPV